MHYGMRYGMYDGIEIVITRAVYSAGLAPFLHSLAYNRRRA